jgi:hypothetical protein
MRIRILVLLVTFTAFSSHAGSLASQFSPGYENVPWGTTLSDLVVLRPGGYHKFSSEPADRTYELVDEAALFG